MDTATAKQAINWQNAPQWTNYYFVDKEGHSYWTQKKPNKDGFFGSGRNEYLGKLYTVKNIRIKRPEND